MILGWQIRALSWKTFWKTFLGDFIEFYVWTNTSHTNRGKFIKNIFFSVKITEIPKSLTLVSLHGGYLARRPGKGRKKETNREMKRKVLAERRKALNIDHLNSEKLKDKVGELQKWASVLEEEKYEFEMSCDRQKYEISHLRQRVQQYMAKTGKGGGQSRGRQIKTITGLGAKAAAFKWLEKSLRNGLKKSWKCLKNVEKCLKKAWN